MDTKWKDLSNPPVVTAIFQLKYDSGSIKLDEFLKFDTVLKREFPNRSENIESSLSLLPSTRIPLGKAQVSGVTDTRRTGYVYFTTDQKEKLTLSETEITYTKESPYTGWDSFKGFVLKVLQTLSSVLEGVTIQRTSIRFINQFNLLEFDDPTEYFNTQITSSVADSSMPYPLLKYGFRMTFDVAEGIYSIVNQNADHLTDRFIYIFDIDVLDRNNILFDVNSIGEILENLREIKNKIFFGNLTNKTLELCS